MAENGIQRSSRRGSIPGVTPIRKDGHVVGYQARTVLPSKQMLTKYFSVRSYGAACALAMAIRERRHQLIEAGTEQLRAETPRTSTKSRPSRITRLLKLAPLDVDLEAQVASDLLAELGSNLAGIKREDITNAEGWSVAVDPGRKSARHYFLDARHGGAEASLKEAITYRNTLPAYRVRRKR
ncbi:hypothetical protein [Lysobacter enzymogenes]|uniref:hypothetical protein n=1 Tax=Lysobacter enzymogenes TaxID=69 RepID=UPI001AF6058B|nr:hypothetical protein [Lysobacter enzymogenes]QQQ00949.1 hypothetical protein JHW41_23260 [Lysobacter enzymogenes]